MWRRVATVNLFQLSAIRNQYYYYNYAIARLSVRFDTIEESLTWTRKLSIGKA